jgi:signal-transduction protein with cAMP-binding, CBS, and nucleotidyltransferase domain
VPFWQDRWAWTRAALRFELPVPNFRHLPVMYDGKVTGMISMRDIPTEYRLMRQHYEQMLIGPHAVVQVLS